MATNYSVTHPTRDPVKEAQEAEREAERWRTVARMALTDEGQIRAEAQAEHYQACARRWYAQAKAGQR